MTDQAYPPAIEHVQPGYVQMEVMVVPANRDCPALSQALCADLQYWLGGTATPFGTDDTLFLEFPDIPERLAVHGDSEVPLTQLELPEAECRRLGLYQLPAVWRVWIAHPAKDQQLRRFDW